MLRRTLLRLRTIPHHSMLMPFELYKVKYCNDLESFKETALLCGLSDSKEIIESYESYCRARYNNYKRQHEYGALYSAALAFPDPKDALNITTNTDLDDYEKQKPL